jgi:hypothetical protein
MFENMHMLSACACGQARNITLNRWAPIVGLPGLELKKPGCQSWQPGFR